MIKSIAGSLFGGVISFFSKPFALIAAVAIAGSVAFHFFKVSSLQLELANLKTNYAHIEAERNTHFENSEAYRVALEACQKGVKELELREAERAEALEQEREKSKAELESLETKLLKARQRVPLGANDCEKAEYMADEILRSRGGESK